ncbi:hypothetical protein RhiirC2_761826, partial [Rhizophagus irregularis]
MTTPNYTTNSKSNSKANGVVRGAYVTQLPLSTVTKPSEKESKKATSSVIFTSNPVPSEKKSRHPYTSSGSGNVTFTPKPDNSSSNST